MRCRRMLKKMDNLGPWETMHEEDSEDMVRFCEQILPPLIGNKTSEYQTDKPKGKEHRSESIINRPKSHAHELREAPQKDIFQRLFDPTQQNHHTKSAHKTTRLENKAHQLIGMKKFILEGEHTAGNKENSIVSRRKQSAFILKQKFAQIRKSVHIPPFNIQPIHHASSQDKEHKLLKIARYNIR